VTRVSPAESPEDAAELARLQAAAFSRGATEQDVEALARFVARRVEPDASEQPKAASDPGVLASSPPSAGDPLPHPVPLPRRSAILLVAIAAAALVGGIAIGWFGATTANQSATRVAPSLAVFDDDRGRVDAAEVFSGPLEDAQVRRLGVLEGVELFGVVGTAPPDAPGLSGDQVCLEMRLPDGSGSAGCTTRESFDREGVAVGDGTRVIAWGPTGPPAILPCFPHEWPDACG
jgi:hypothetical protein